MLSSRLLLSLVFVPAFVSAAVFPPDSLVKMLDAKSFKKAMKANQTSMVAFVAPWCGHCQRLVPEYSKAALGLHPLLPLYAVDCDEDKNKRLCSEQGVQGFPTIKLFQRGNDIPPMTYDGGERTASALFYYVTRRVPKSYAKLYKTEEIIPWIEKTVDVKHTLLLTKDKKVPLLWQVLANKYKGQLEFGTHRDRNGKSSVALGFEAGEKKESKVLVYSPGSMKPFRYEGINKLDSLSKFFDSVIDGTADLTVANEEAKAEEYEQTEEELEIQRMQEAQRIALLHGGFSDPIYDEDGQALAQRIFESALVLAKSCWGGGLSPQQSVTSIQHQCGSFRGSFCFSYATDRQSTLSPPQNLLFSTDGAHCLGPPSSAGSWRKIYSGR